MRDASSGQLWCTSGVGSSYRLARVAWRDSMRNDRAMNRGRHAISAGLFAIAASLIVAPTAGAAKPPRVFKNCKAVDTVYPHGIAKNFKVIKAADGLTGRPFVSMKLYLAQKRTLDRDHDGVACET
jgi:excalibur calcium-binding domain-containing protein